MDFWSGLFLGFICGAWFIIILALGGVGGGDR